MCVCVCVCVCVSVRERETGGRREGGKRVWRDYREKMGVCDYMRGMLRVIKRKGVTWKLLREATREESCS